MLIISNFHDYYDSIPQTTGIDKTCVWQRKTEQVPDKLMQDLQMTRTNWGRIINDVWRHNSYSRDFPRIEAHPFLIGFCGKLYPGYKTAINEEKSILWNKKDLLEFITQNITTRYLGWYQEQIDNFFNLREQEKIEIFQNYNTPIFLWKQPGRDSKLELNPCLKDYEFYKIFDAYSAYQEIYMFKMGVLGIDENPTVEISERDKVASKGFDKWSFRNPDPPKRKQKSKKFRNRKK